MPQGSISSGLMQMLVRCISWNELSALERCRTDVGSGLGRDGRPYLVSCLVGNAEARPKPTAVERLQCSATVCQNAAAASHTRLRQTHCIRSINKLINKSAAAAERNLVKDDRSKCTWMCNVHCSRAQSERVVPSFQLLALIAVVTWITWRPNDRITATRPRHSS